MKFLVNENISNAVIVALRKRGHDVLSAKESMRGAGDWTGHFAVADERRVRLRPLPISKQ